MYARFSVTFDTPCTFSCKWTTAMCIFCGKYSTRKLNGAAVKHQGTCIAASAGCGEHKPRASTWVEVQGSGPAQSTNKLRLERSERLFRETFWGGEIQTHVSNLVDTTELYSNVRSTVQGRPYGLENFWKQKRSLLWGTWKCRHTKSTYQRITSMLII